MSNYTIKSLQDSYMYLEILEADGSPSKIDIPLKHAQSLMNDYSEDQKIVFSENENYSYSIGTLVTSDDLEFYQNDSIIPIDNALAIFSQCISNLMKKILTS